MEPQRQVADGSVHSEGDPRLTEPASSRPPISLAVSLICRPSLQVDLVTVNSDPSGEVYFVDLITERDAQPVVLAADATGWKMIPINKAILPFRTCKNG